MFGGAPDKSAAGERFDGRVQRTLWAVPAMLQTIGVGRNVGVQLTLTERGYYPWVMMMRELRIVIDNV